MREVRDRPGSMITTVAGNGTEGYTGDGGPATGAQFNRPRDMAVGTDGSLYIADTIDHCILKVNPRGIISTVVGTGTSGYSGDGGPGAKAQLNAPRDVEGNSSRAPGIAGILPASDAGYSHGCKQDACDSRGG